MNTGLGRDEHPHRFGDRKPATAVDALLGEEDRDVPPQLRP